MKKIKIFITSGGMALLPLAVLAQANPGQQIINMVQQVAKFAMVLLIGIGVLFLVLAGFQFVLARGDESKLSTARAMLLWSVIGIAVGALGPMLVNWAISLTGAAWW